jgi:hypothetical protein
MWNEERIAELKRLIGLNLSASKIAIEMGLPSRSVVCGKARRLGLHINGQSSHSQGQRESKRRVPQHRKSSGPRRYPVYREPKHDEPTPYGEVKFKDAEAHHCRMHRPLRSGAEGLICARRVVEGKSYCVDHYLRTVHADCRAEAAARLANLTCTEVAA